MKTKVKSFSAYPRIVRILRVGILLLTVLSAELVSAQNSKLIVLVRHAEKEDVPRDNPALTEAGWDRAAALAEMLEDTHIDHIITSHLDRTILTAKYVAEARGLTPEEVSIESGLLTHLEAVVDAVHRRPDGEAILVVGHSNTIPGIVNALTGKEYSDLENTVYSTVFIVTLADDEEPRIIVSSFGAKN